MMDSQEDAALLVLIHQHLQLRGHSAAAQLLEEHLTQVEMPMESLNLHDIYTGWMKLCSLAQRAKQETEIDLKTGIVKQVEKEEEVASVKPLIETDPEVVSEPHLDAADETQTGKSDSSSFEGEAKEEREETFRGVEPVQAEGRSSVSASSNTEKTSEPIQGDPDPIVQPDTPAISEPIEVSDSESEQEMEDRQGGDEEEQRAAINSPEETKGTSEQIDVAQGALVCSSRETNVAAEEEKEEKEEEEEEEEQHAAAERPVSSDLPAEESSNQGLEREALPPADTVFENPQESFPRTDGEGSSSEMEPENEPKAAIKDQPDADPPGKAEEMKDEDDCTILNIQADCSEAAVLEPVEVCEEWVTPRKKKNKKKKSSNNGCAETSQVDLTDTLSYDAACTDTTLTSTSKKKKREKKMDEMLNGEEEDKTEAAEQSQLVTPKKKAKKRKRRGDEMEENQDETIIPPEKIQKKKLLDVIEDKTEMGVIDDSSLPEMKRKKKKKKKKRGELQFKEAPAEGSKEEINSLAENSNISTAKKKKHVRTKLSLKKRLMFGKKEMMMMMTARRTHSPNQILAGRKRHKQKSPQLNTERESSSKENQPPSKKKKNKKRAVGNIPEVPEGESTIPKEHKKKKKLKAEEISPPVVVDQLPPAKKKKKDRLKIKLEEAADEDFSRKKKKSHKKRKN